MFAISRTAGRSKTDSALIAGSSRRTAANCNAPLAAPVANYERCDFAGTQATPIFRSIGGVSRFDALRMNSLAEVAVVELCNGRGEPSRGRRGRNRSRTVRTFREEQRRHGGFAGETLTTRARTQRSQDRDIGRWGRNPMKTKLLLALASLAAIMSLGCASAAPRYTAYRVPPYQASVEVQAPIGEKPEVVARITFGELGGSAR